MPRLRQVPKSEATAPIVTTMYEWLFEGRDPVAEPGTFTGAPGDWWTRRLLGVFAPVLERDAAGGVTIVAMPDELPVHE